MRGALLGLLLLLAWPLILLAVIVCAPRGRYPWWLITPDDPFALGHDVPHFGAYEPTVRRVYLNLGRVLGDIYWLGLRNSAYGVRYRLKPDRFKGLIDYRNLRITIVRGRRLTLYCVEGFRCWQVSLGRFELLAGWMVRGAALDPFTIRQPVNMEFRPVFSPRKAG